MKLCGVYVLVLCVPPCKVRIGALGDLAFEGCYAYVGSAQGGLEFRLRRHLRKHKKKRWHIDYLTDVGKVEGIFVKVGAAKEEECITAGIMSDVFVGVQRFGSSDCQCVSHLFKIDDMDCFLKIMANNGYTKWEDFTK